jgi:hypothetical protein
MFTLKNNKKKIRALTDEIISKWSQSHASDAKWEANCRGTLIHYVRDKYAMSFEGSTLTFSYDEHHISESKELIQSKDLQYKFEFDLKFVNKVEALNLNFETVQELWGDEGLKLGVRLIPASGSKAFRMEIKGLASVLDIKRGASLRTQSVNEVHVLEKGFLLFGKNDKSDTTGKKVFEELVALLKEEAGLGKKMF